MLHQYETTLTPRQYLELLWSQCVNTHSASGRNIPSDLYQEHLNRLCKNSVRGLQNRENYYEDWENIGNTGSSSW